MFSDGLRCKNVFQPQGGLDSQDETYSFRCLPQTPTHLARDKVKKQAVGHGGVETLYVGHSGRSFKKPDLQNHHCHLGSLPTGLGHDPALLWASVSLSEWAGLI